MKEGSSKHSQAIIDIEAEYRKQRMAKKGPEEFRIGVNGVTKVRKVNLYSGELFVRKADSDCGEVEKKLELTEQDNELFMMGFEGSPSGEKSIFGKVHDVNGIGHSETSPSITGNGKWPFIVSTKIKPNNVGGNALVIKANLKEMNPSSNQFKEIKNKIKLPIEAADLVFRCDLQIISALDFMMQKLNVYQMEISVSSKRRTAVIRKSNIKEMNISRQAMQMEVINSSILEHTQQLENRIAKVGELQAKIEAVQNLISYLNRASELHQFLLYTLLRTELKEDSIEKSQIQFVIGNIGEMSRQFNEFNFQQDFQKQIFYSSACQQLTTSLESSFEYFKNLENDENDTREIDEYERLVSIFNDIIQLEQTKLQESQNIQIGSKSLEDVTSGIKFNPELEAEDKDEWQLVEHDPNMYEFTQEISQMGSQSSLLNASMDNKLKWNHFDNLIYSKDNKVRSKNVLLQRMNTIEINDPVNESQINSGETNNNLNEAKISLFGYNQSIGNSKFLI